MESKNSMLSLPRPTHIDVENTFRTCSGSIQNVAVRSSVLGICPEIVGAATQYAQLAESAALHIFPQPTHLDPGIRTQLKSNYTGRMAKPNVAGRPVYDEIRSLAPNNICPFCGVRLVSTLDHVLPKEPFQNIAVLPDNLIPCCRDCNTEKWDTVPNSCEEVVVHPYFDEVHTQSWLRAEVFEKQPVSVRYFVEPTAAYEECLNARIANQFTILRLGQLYASHAASQLASMQQNILRIFNASGAAAVQNELTFQWNSARSHQLNSWQTALFGALKNNEWYYNGGFYI